jgi:hypothetical protein
MIKLLDSITKPAAGELEGMVALCGSHGGVYAAYLAARTRARAVVLHDAGIGLQHAGIACIAYCQALGMAAATVDYRSARIGDGADMLARGRISFANAVARAAGCAPGMSAGDAVQALQAAPAWSGEAPAYAEGQGEIVVRAGAEPVIYLDSASMAAPEHAGRILAIGSHGALLGGDPAAALRTEARAALYNDAGIGIDGAGTTRLPALDARGIAAVTVSAASARIGDGRSTLQDGIISAANAGAAQAGAVTGMPALDWARLLVRRAERDAGR